MKISIDANYLIFSCGNCSEVTILDDVVPYYDCWDCSTDFCNSSTKLPTVLYSVIPALFLLFKLAWLTNQRSARHRLTNQRSAWHRLTNQLSARHRLTNQPWALSSVWFVIWWSSSDYWSVLGCVVATLDLSFNLPVKNLFYCFILTTIEAISTETAVSIVSYPDK